MDSPASPEGLRGPCGSAPRLGLARQLARGTLLVGTALAVLLGPGSWYLGWLVALPQTTADMIAACMALAWVWHWTARLRYRRAKAPDQPR